MKQVMTKNGDCVSIRTVRAILTCRILSLLQEPALAHPRHGLHVFDRLYAGTRKQNEY